MKAKVKKTGEIIDVSRTENIITSRGVEKQYFDNKREWCTYVKSELEFINEEPQRNIDWEQRRYEIAKEVLPDQILFWEKCNELDADDNNDEPWGNSYETAAKFSVIVADTPIAELRKGGEK